MAAGRTPNLLLFFLPVDTNRSKRKCLAPEFKKVGQLLLADQIALSLCSLLVVVFMIWCGHLITSLINGAIAVEDPLLLIQVMTNDAGMLGMLLLALLGAYSATRRFFSTYAESTWITILSSLLRWVVLAGLNEADDVMVSLEIPQQKLLLGLVIEGGVS